jgi:CHAT domain-containing protein
MHQSGTGLANALKKVQSGFVKRLDATQTNYSHPFFWANFTVVGDGNKGLQSNIKIANGVSE